MFLQRTLAELRQRLTIEIGNLPPELVRAYEEGKTLRFQVHKDASGSRVVVQEDSVTLADLRELWHRDRHEHRAATGAPGSSPVSQADASCAQDHL